MKFQLTHPPTDDDSLYWVIQAMWGITIPRTPVCPDHVPPFRAFADAYFGRNSLDPASPWTSMALWHGCVPGDAQVMTESGPVAIAAISEGDRVLGWKDGQLDYGKAARTWISSPAAPVFALRTRAGRLRATGNHRVLVARKHRGIPDGQHRRPPNTWPEQWVRLDEVRVGDFLVQPFGYGPRAPAEADDDLAEWLGLICGDGFITRDKSNKHAYRVHIAHHPAAGYMDHYRAFVRRRYGRVLRPNPTNYTSRVTGREVWEDVSVFEGKRAATKELPAFLWSAPRSSILAFLRGYTDADGTVRTKDGSIEWSSVSRALLEQIRHICLMHELRVGIVATVYKAGKHRFQGHDINRRDMYALRCYDGADIGTNDPKYDFGTRTKRALSKRNAWVAPLPRPDRRYMRVLEIQDLGEQEVWDMTVDGTDTFTCDSFVVHNSRGLSGKSVALSILGLTRAVLTGADVTLLGGSYAQSANIHAHVRKAITFRNAPEAMVVEETANKITLSNGASIHPLTASQRAIRGPHRPVLLCDEIDEMDLPILDGALGQPMPQINYLGETIKPYTVMCSTWQRPSGTFSEVMRRHEEQGFPLYKWCMEESANPVDGWLSREAIEEKKRTIPAAMWESEYLLNEPSIGTRAFDTPSVDRAFSLPFLPVAHKVSKDFEEATFEVPEKHGSYVAGADWGREKDYTVVAIGRVDVVPFRLVYYLRVNRRPYPQMIKWFNDAINRFHAQGAHDATGLGNVVDDYVDTRARRFVMTGEKRSAMLSAYVSAIESDRWRFPKVKTAYVETKFAEMGDLYSSRQDYHLPDTVCAFALMHYMAQKMAPGAAPVLLKRDNEKLTKLGSMFVADPTEDHAKSPLSPVPAEPGFSFLA